MSQEPYSRFVEHPYSKNKQNELYHHFRRTEFVHQPYSAGAIPFRWMLRGSALGNDREAGIVDELRLGFSDEIEPELGDWNNWVQEKTNQLVLLDTFFSAAKPDSSLCFFYAKDTPLSEDPRRVLIGVGRIKNVDAPVDYAVAGSDPPLRCVLWERNIHHSIRPDRSDGFLLPYHELYRRAKSDPGIVPSEYLALVPEAHQSNFSFVAEHVTDDAALAVLLECRSALKRLRTVVEGDWSAQERWLDQQIDRIWKMRGPYPGFGAALNAFGFQLGNLLAVHIETTLENSPNADPWELLSEVLEDPRMLPEALRDLADPVLSRTWAGLASSRRALLKLLSRFDLTSQQATRFYQPTERKKAGIEASDGSLLGNPYLLYEMDRGSVDGIAFDVIDRGLFPDDSVRTQFPVDKRAAMESDLDSRRVRAVVVDTLEVASREGHTLQVTEDTIQSIRDRPAARPCLLSEDTMATMEGNLTPAVVKVDTSAGAAYQLERFAGSRDMIRRTVLRRLDGARHLEEVDWEGQLAAVLGPPSEGAEPDVEQLARTEKAAALAELFQSRFTVLFGPAGSGKTTILKALCRIPSVRRGGVLLLAPTGKARVRLEQATGMHGAQTLAQFLLKTKRYHTATGRYLVTGSSERSVGHATVVVDEASMLTEEQLASLIDALKGVERLILVGDSQQLPPIGAGRPFADVVAFLAEELSDGRFPRRGRGCAELTVRLRQKGMAREDLLFADWFSGRPMDPGADEIWERIRNGEGFQHIRFRTWDSAQDLERLVVSELVDGFDLEGPDDVNGFERLIGGSEFKGAVYFHPTKDDQAGAGSRAEQWQVLSPVRAERHGVSHLNRFFQNRFRARALSWARPDMHWHRRTAKPYGREGILYGDKVINVSNSRRYRYPGQNDRGYVANGEIGVVVGPYRPHGQKWKIPARLDVEFGTQEGFRYRYPASEVGDESTEPLELAYAVTIHKSQGSEFGTTFVIIPADCWILSRELMYTALTRQRDRVVVFHQGPIEKLREYTMADRSEAARRLTNLFRQPAPLTVEGTVFDQGLIHRTRRGELVRSKSEVIIGDTLDHLGLDYEYESIFHGEDGSLRYPDFAVRDEESGRLLLIEHLGMMDLPEYRKRWERKVKWYKINGVTPLADGWGPRAGLLITRDDRTGGIDSNAIERDIREALGLS